MNEFGGCVGYVERWRELVVVVWRLGGGPLQAAEGEAAAARVPVHPGGVHQERAEEPQARDPACAGGGQAHPERAARHRPVPRDGRQGPRDRRPDQRRPLLCACAVDPRPRGAQALGLGGAAPPRPRCRVAGRHPAARGRLIDSAAAGRREARRQVHGRRRPRHSEARDP